MKKFTFLFILIVVLCFTNFSFAQLSRQQAIDSVLNQIIPADTGKVNLYFALSSYSITDSIQLSVGSAISCPFENNYVLFVNDHPFANWNHPCRYIFMDTITGDYSIVNKNTFPLNINNDFEIVLEVPVPVPTNLPVNTDAIVEGLEPNPHLFAVLISGKRNENPNINDTIDKYRFSNDVAVVYNTLIEVYGYTKDNIFVHFYDGNGTNPNYLNDFDAGSPSNDIDYPAYKDRIMETFLT